jgi:hypothetical protein
LEGVKSYYVKIPGNDEKIGVFGSQENKISVLTQKRGMPITNTETLYLYRKYKVEAHRK